MLDVSNGEPRMRIWPSPRGKSATEAQAAQRAWFRQASWAIKWMNPDMVAQVMAARQGLPLLPRDMLMMMLSGRLASTFNKQGQRIYPMAARLDVSESLDTISQIQNTILVRGPEYWVGVTFDPNGPAAVDINAMMRRQMMSQQASLGAGGPYIDAKIDCWGSVCLGGGGMFSQGYAARWRATTAQYIVPIGTYACLDGGWCNDEVATNNNFYASRLANISTGAIAGSFNYASNRNAPGDYIISSDQVFTRIADTTVTWPPRIAEAGQTLAVEFWNPSGDSHTRGMSAVYRIALFDTATNELLPIIP